MKLTKKHVTLVSAMIASLLGSSAMADSNWQTYEFEDGGTFYVDCLGENITAQNWITVVSREFTSPSANGNYHYIEQWTWDAEWTGDDSGNVWLGEGLSPGSFQVMKGEVGQWTSRVRLIPFEGDGPRIMVKSRFKYTVDANGNLRVSYVPIQADVRCLGPNH